jgi:hypothetical protein
MSIIQFGQHTTVSTQYSKGTVKYGEYPKLLILELANPDVLIQALEEIQKNFQVEGETVRLRGQNSCYSVDFQRVFAEYTKEKLTKIFNANIVAKPPEIEVTVWWDLFTQIYGSKPDLNLVEFTWGILPVVQTPIKKEETIHVEPSLQEKYPHRFGFASDYY